MPQTEAQRAAAERNLRKGNPAAYSKRRDEREDDAGGQPPADPPSKAKTYRARAKSGKAEPKPRKRKAPAKPATEPAQASRPEPSDKRGSSGGFFAGLAEGLGL